jgi:hypothetical protein
MSVSCNIGEMEKVAVPKSVFKLSEHKDVYVISYEDMISFLESFFQSRSIRFLFCKRCRAFNCEIDDLVFRVTCKPHPKSKSVIVDYERMSGCPLIFAEVYRYFRSSLGDIISPPIAFSHYMELKDVPTLSHHETVTAVAALKFWILCDPVEASEAIEAYHDVLDPLIFRTLREEAIESCRHLTVGAESCGCSGSSPEKGLATCCCCWEENDGSSDYDESRSSLSSLAGLEVGPESSQMRLT